MDSTDHKLVLWTAILEYFSLTNIISYYCWLIHQLIDHSLSTIRMLNNDELKPFN